ncbi:MAG TPA: hypothetical protein VMU11_02345 [Verrucomicrobiae bacterium]|nr:hypothetical protein [Verrucomicrobiae bacterium]
MGRLAQALGFLTLGALAAGAGTAAVVIKANADINALQAQAADAQTRAAGAISDSKKLSDEANRKLESASQEIAKAQARIQALEDERKLIANATPLSSPKAAAGWKEYVSIPLGFTIRMPAPAVDPQFTDHSFDAGWLLITPYEGESVDADESYLVKNHVIFGQSSNGSHTYVVQSDGMPSLLIRAFPNSGITDKQVLDVLSTLTFKNP